MPLSLSVCIRTDLQLCDATVQVTVGGSTRITSRSDTAPPVAYPVHEGMLLASVGYLDTQ